jgi:hypothetical protein
MSGNHDQTRLALPKSMRLVIQFVPGPGASPASYVLLVYPGPKNSPSGSVRFYSREELLLRLQNVISNFQGNLEPEDSAVTHLVFAETVTLSDAQLLSLGLE